MMEKLPPPPEKPAYDEHNPASWLPFTREIPDDGKPSIHQFHVANDPYRAPRKRYETNPRFVAPLPLEEEL